VVTSAGRHQQARRTRGNRAGEGMRRAGGSLRACVRLGFQGWPRFGPHWRERGESRVGFDGPRLGQGVVQCLGHKNTMARPCEKKKREGYL
jgi:hypothetical protein